MQKRAFFVLIASAAVPARAAEKAAQSGTAAVRLSYNLYYVISKYRYRGTWL